MKTLCLLLAAASIVVSGTRVDAANVLAGTVSEIEGKVTATDTEGKARQLAVQSEVFLNDKIVTDAGAKVEILLTDNSELSQGENGEMVINDYVFGDDAGKKAGCTLKCVKGLFRILTGKIVEMNPDQFRVQTRMATIGIRGCELGFEVGEEDEDVYVFDLPEGHSIEVEQTSGGDTRERRLTIRKAGAAVAIRRRMALKERAFTTEEKDKFFKRALLRRALLKREAIREKLGGEPKPDAKHKPLLRPKAKR